MVDLKKLAKNLECDSTGIWRPLRRHSGSTAISYPQSGHDHCLQIEESSFWFQHRNRCILAALEQITTENKTRPQEQRFLDVGAGNGFVAQAVRAAGYPVVAIEPGENGAKNMKTRGLESVICADLNSCEFISNSFQVIGAFDVVEHVADDVQLLKQMRPLLTAKGKLLLTVPAYPWLWSNDDIYAGHYRRYTDHTLTRTLKSAGFEVVYMTYFFRFLVIPIFIFKSLPFIVLSFIFKNHSHSHPNIKSARHQHSYKNQFVQILSEFALKNETIKIKLHNKMLLGSSLLVIAQPD